MYVSCSLFRLIRVQKKSTQVSLLAYFCLAGCVSDCSSYPVTSNAHWSGLNKYINDNSRRPVSTYVRHFTFYAQQCYTVACRLLWTIDHCWLVYQCDVYINPEVQLLKGSVFRTEWGSLNPNAPFSMIHYVHLGLSGKWGHWPKLTSG